MLRAQREGIGLGREEYDLTHSLSSRFKGKVVVVAF